MWVRKVFVFWPSCLKHYKGIFHAIAMQLCNWYDGFTTFYRKYVSAKMWLVWTHTYWMTFVNAFRQPFVDEITAKLSCVENANSSGWQVLLLACFAYPTYFLSELIIHIPLLLLRSDNSSKTKFPLVARLSAVRLLTRYDIWALKGLIYMHHLELWNGI